MRPGRSGTREVDAATQAGPVGASGEAGAAVGLISDDRAVLQHNGGGRIDVQAAALGVSAEAPEPPMAVLSARVVPEIVTLRLPARAWKITAIPPPWARPPVPPVAGESPWPPCAPHGPVRPQDDRSGHGVGRRERRRDHGQCVAQLHAAPCAAPPVPPTAPVPPAPPMAEPARNVLLEMVRSP